MSKFVPALAVSGTVALGLLVHFTDPPKAKATAAIPARAVSAKPTVMSGRDQRLQEANEEAQKLNRMRREQADQKPITMSQVHWRRGGFNTVMLLDFTLRNDNDYAVKDFTIKCVHYAPSGTQIDRNSRILYERLPPHSSRSWQQFGMGFFHSQVAKSSCEVVDYAKS